MAKTATKVMTKAISYIGTKEVPAGSNNVKFNTDYYGKAVSGSAYPWCCTYVWDIFRMCGMSDLFYDGKKTAYCPTVEGWAKQKKLTVDKTKGKYGDIVLFDFSGKSLAGHIGFIEKKNADGTYTCVEGNTSLSSNDNGGCVMRRTRNLSVIRCIVRPKYDSEKKATTTKPTPKKTTKMVVAKPIIRKGSKGGEVKNLQNNLNKVIGCKLTVDGICGDSTIKQLKAFQKKYKLTVDGVYGQKSFEAMSKLIK